MHNLNPVSIIGGKGGKRREEKPSIQEPQVHFPFIVNQTGGGGGVWKSK